MPSMLQDGGQVTDVPPGRICRYSAILKRRAAASLRRLTSRRCLAVRAFPVTFLLQAGNSDSERILETDTGVLFGIDLSTAGQGVIDDLAISTTSLVGSDCVQDGYCETNRVKTEPPTPGAREFQTRSMAEAMEMGFRTSQSSVCTVCAGVPSEFESGVRTTDYTRAYLGDLVTFIPDQQDAAVISNRRRESQINRKVCGCGRGYRETTREGSVGPGGDRAQEVLSSCAECSNKNTATTGNNKDNDGDINISNSEDIGESLRGLHVDSMVKDSASSPTHHHFYSTILNSSTRDVPRIHVKLCRMKSSTCDLTEDDDKENDDDDNDNKLPVSSTVTPSGRSRKAVRIADVISSATPTSQEKGKKRNSGYWGRLRAIFNTTPALRNLTRASTEDLSNLKSVLSKHSLQNSTPDCEGSDESFGDTVDRTNLRVELTTLNTLLEHSTPPDQRRKSKTDFSEGCASHQRSLSESESGLHATDAVTTPVSHDDLNTLAPLAIEARERNYSLLSSNDKSGDPSTINFTRIPSMRRRKVLVQLLHHFTTVDVPSEEDDIHVIKEATHVHPLTNGQAIVTDMLSNKIVLFDARGLPIITFSVEHGSEPWATCQASEGVMAVTLKRQGCVSLWSMSGEPVTEFGQTVLSSPTGIQCDLQGRFVVTDEQANSVFLFDKKGKLLGELTGPEVAGGAPRSNMCAHSYSTTFGSMSSLSSSSFFNQPRYVCITLTGNYVITDSANHTVKVFDSDQNYLGQFGGYGRRDGQLRFPYGVASDNEGFIYVADYFNNRVSLFNSEGEFVEHLLTSENDDITRPKSVAVSGSLLYITYGDLRSNKVSVYKLLKTQGKGVLIS